LSCSLVTAVGVIRSGEVVAHATEGVWGFACDPSNYAAVMKILQLKNRPKDKGLLLLGAEIGMFRNLVNLQPAHLQTAIEDSWPGHHTWVLPNIDFPDWISGGRRTVACRVPGHSQARALVKLYGAPIVSTSANFADQPAITSEAEVCRVFGSLVDYVLPGKIGSAVGPSTIHALDGSILRAQA